MAELAYKGKDLAFLKIGTDKLLGIKEDLKISISRGTIGANSNESGGYNDKIIGNADITISGSFLYYKEADTSTAQQALLAAAFAGTKVTIEYAYEELVGSKKWAGIGSVSIDDDNGEIGSVSFTIEVLENPTEGTQAA